MRIGGAVGVSAFLAGAAVANALGHEDARTTPPHGPPAVAPPAFARRLHASAFARGNLHTHSTRSDGDASPADVTRWYAEHGYAFVALTDHNAIGVAPPASGAASGIVTVPGEEVSMRVHGAQVHVNALCTRSLVAGGDFPTVNEALAHALGGILGQGGVALINHPNFDWALTADDVASADGAQLLEIASGHPYVHSSGDASHPSHEALWDDALTRGHDVMGVAVDDTHHLVTDAEPEAFPGVAWVAVFVASSDGVDAATVCDALREGLLYASTGAELASLDVEGATYTVRPQDREAIVTFVGAGGQVLARSLAGRDGARYRVVGDERYVRATVEGAHGLAWTPAVRVAR